MNLADWRPGSVVKKPIAVRFIAHKRLLPRSLLVLLLQSEQDPNGPQKVTGHCASSFVMKH
jgi:hypothetical protein